MKKLIGPVGSRHSLMVIVHRTWKKDEKSDKTWCRGVAELDGDRVPVGFWTRSKRANWSAQCMGTWEILRIRDAYTQLKMKGKVQWLP